MIAPFLNSWGGKNENLDNEEVIEIYLKVILHNV